LKVVPISFDSMGTRSMATFIETDDVKIFIDPGVSLAPIRFGLRPHALELKRLDKDWEKIVRLAKKSNILIVTHYHYDHYNPWENIEIYKDKVLLTKHPTENINFSQRKRASFFLSQIKGLPKKVEYADGKEFKFGDTRIKISEPVYHGTNPKLGFVIEVLIDDGEEKIIHTSDVEGPSQKNQVDFILKNEPNIVILDGPLSYMMYRFGKEAMKASIENMKKIVRKCGLDVLIIDHHFLRDLKWRERIKEVFRIAGKTEIKTAAEFLGKENEMLEARRRELYELYPGMKYRSKMRFFQE